MAGPNDSNGYEREIRLMEADDRGVFGPYGLQISAALRRRFQTVLQPANTRAQIMLRSAEQGKVAEAEKIFMNSLPRNDIDLQDERYFGIYWGLAEVALQRNDRIAALDWFQQAIMKFPTAVRKNHLRRLIHLGVQLAKWVNGTGEILLSETDAAAILTRIRETVARWSSAGVAPIEEMQLDSAQRKLETNTPLGRWAAARRHRG